MSEPQQYRATDRRRHQITHEELRRQLIAADAERYGLRRQLRGQWAPQRRRLTAGVGAAVVGMIASAALWERAEPLTRGASPAPGVQTFVVSPLAAKPTIGPEPLLLPAVITPVAQQIVPSQNRAPKTAEMSRRQSMVRAQVQVPTHREHHTFLVRALLHVKPHLWPTTWRRPAAPRPVTPGEFGRSAS